MSLERSEQATFFSIILNTSLTLIKYILATLSGSVALMADKETISEHFGEAPYFSIITLRAKDGTLVKQEYLHNPYLQEEEGKGIRVSEWLVQKGIDRIFTKKSFEGKGPFYVFSNARVKMIITSKKRLHDLEYNIEH
jgi:predicted Fe-Mo cluster-binding NifX family protein